MQSLIELVSFKLVADADEKEFESMQIGMNEWVKQQPGFYYRTLVKDTDGSFIDIVHWASEADAKAAAEKFMQSPDTTKMLSLIDEESVNMRHMPSFSEIGSDQGGTN